ncbi:MAG: hypothetical protein KGI25_08690, partial [Thaumarchaeota archaeon]|nr:hypothetical protein [Nitrososphaerota archaeon]
MDIKNVSFKQYLQLDESVLFEVEKKKKIPKPKPRPKKILWFGDKDHWNNDLQFAHGGKFGYHTSQEQEEEARNIYAVDSNTNACYGIWQGKHNRGVTFHIPKPLHAVKHPRVLIKPFMNGTIAQSNL